MSLHTMNMKNLRKYITTVSRMIETEGRPSDEIITKIWNEGYKRLSKSEAFWHWYCEAPGGNPIDPSHTGGIAKQKNIDHEKIDNRVSVSFPARIVENRVGYLLGEAQRVVISRMIPKGQGLLGKTLGVVKTAFGGKVTQELEDKYTQEDKDLLADFRAENDMPDQDVEVGKYMAACGYAGRLLSLADSVNKETGKPEKYVKVEVVEPWACLFLATGEIYDPTYALRAYTEADESGKEIRILRFYTVDKIFVFAFNEMGRAVYTHEEEHAFGGVPLIGYPNNGELLPAFWRGISKIIDYQERVSSRSSELEAERDGYTVFLDIDISEKERESARKKGGVLGHSKKGCSHPARIERLEKHIDTAAHKDHLERLKEDVDRDCGHVDLDDEKVVGAASYIALKLKTLPLEIQGMMFQKKFVAADLQIYWLLFNYVHTTTGRFLYYRDVSTTWIRSLPKNLPEEVDMVTKLKGVTSDVTAFSVASFISDPEKEKEAVDAQNQNMDRVGLGVSRKEPHEEAEMDALAKSILGGNA